MNSKEILINFVQNQKLLISVIVFCREIVKFIIKCWFVVYSPESSPSIHVFYPIAYLSTQFSSHTLL